MKKKVIVGISAVIILTVALIGMIKYREYKEWVAWDNARKVEFEDPEMERIICLRAMWEAEDPSVFFGERNMYAEEDFSKVRIDHVEHIEKLNIGYTGYYDTLADIEKCSNLEYLFIGDLRSNIISYPFEEDCVTPSPEPPERIEQIETELEGILQNCPRLSTLVIENTEGTCELSSLQFLSAAQELGALYLSEQGDIDYSPILECTELGVLDLSKCNISDLGEISRLEKLRILDLKGTNIAEAGDIVNIKMLNWLIIKNTPLAENEEELQKIYDAFPDIKIEK